MRFMQLLISGKTRNIEMEQNETGCQAPQASILCVNNCGFFGTATTMNMCSKCYKDLVLNQEQTKLAASSIQSIVNGSSSSNSENDSNAAALTAKAHAAAATSETIVAPPQTTTAAAPPASEASQEAKGPTRCGTCRKRVGLTGFNCRCGTTFCAIHRYSDKHECPFDYRTAAQEAIAKANPVVKAEKIDKI
ncbi:hypothetical protein ACP275_02G132000 [Erythranthe tilingii]